MAHSYQYFVVTTQSDNKKWLLRTDEVPNYQHLAKTIASIIGAKYDAQVKITYSFTPKWRILVDSDYQLEILQKLCRKKKNDLQLLIFVDEPIQPQTARTIFNELYEKATTTAAPMPDVRHQPLPDVRHQPLPDAKEDSM